MLIERKNGKTLAVPTINNNGSPPECLVKGLSHACDLLRNLQGVLRNISPHGRDYQTESAAVIHLGTAIHQHEARITALKGIEQELTDIAIAIQDQQE